MRTPDDDASTVQRQEPAVPLRRVFRLLIESGPDSPRQVELGTSYLRTLLGQSATCQVQLKDREVSRRHVALEVSQVGVKITDLSSTNGTFVNGARVEVAHLTGSERIQIGSTILRLVRTDEMVAETSPPATGFGKIVGASPGMRELYVLCRKIAGSDLPVLIEGETGTGKEVLAESIHEESARQRGPFIVFDCTAVPPNLAESELFGHEKGAFTGAIQTRRGVFEQADTGTLFIDEVGELDSALQPKLLRALERSEIRRVGGDRWIRVNVRIISATRRDMDREVQSARFRDDLFFRLAVARLELPPVRARAGDVATLLRYFWSSLGGKGAVSYEMEQRFERHSWPGNVRELRNAVVREIALGSDFALKHAPPAPLPGADPFGGILAQELPYPRARDLALAAFEHRYLTWMLQKHGSVAKAAQAAGVARRYFNVLLARQPK